VMQLSSRSDEAPHNTSALLPLVLLLLDSLAAETDVQRCDGDAHFQAQL